ASRRFWCYHPSWYPCDCEPCYLLSDDDNDYGEEDEEESDWSWAPDEEGEEEDGEEDEREPQRVPAEEPVQHYVCAIRAVCKAEEDSDDEEQSAQPVRRLICGAAIAQPVKAPNKSPAVAESKAEADVGNGYSVFPGSILWIQDPDVHGYDYKRIFGRCCDETVTKVVVEDTYIAGDEQQCKRERVDAKNFRDFCNMLAENCPALEVLELWTPTDPRKQLELFFKELRDSHKISIIYKKHKQHPRRYRFNNGWTVLADRGLGIFGGTSNDSDSSNPTFFAYCPPGTPFPDPIRTKDEAACSTPSTSKSPYASQGASIFGQHSPKSVVKNSRQCALWEEKWHARDSCNYYHPTEYCDDYPECPLGAKKCHKAHHFCSTAKKREFCSCAPGKLNPQLNHRFPPKNAKR
ncbi:MIT domain-containing protein, partial [Aphelenchoides avenae]